MDPITEQRESQEKATEQVESPCMNYQTSAPNTQENLIKVEKLPDPNEETKTRENRQNCQEEHKSKEKGTKRIWLRPGDRGI